MNYQPGANPAAGPPAPPPGTQTTTTVTETHVQTNLRWDPLYVRTIPGILKVAEIVLDLIGFICIMSAGNAWANTTTGG